MNLDELRSHLSGLDRRLLELIAERQRVSREIARVKRATGYPTRDYARERDVILAVRSGAAELGVPADAAEEVMRVLIRSSLATQEQASVAAGGAGSGRSALVIGGAGKIGGWFAQFLGSQGFDVEIADPAAGAGAVNGALADWRTSPLRHDYIVVATPLGVTDGILR
jgi:chorismate mutase / prephenate dehydrogenase